MFFVIILSIIGLCVVSFIFHMIAVMIAVWRHNKYLMQSMDWQQQKQQKIQQGWLPTLWDEDATEEEKREAIVRYARGEDLK